MSQTKTHVQQYIGNGKAMKSKSSCGLSTFNRNGRFNNIQPLKNFKEHYEANGLTTKYTCVKCLAKAKEQGRM